jgi:hypothetical protein
VAQQTADEARVRFEKQNPRLSYEEWETKKRRKR